MLKLLLDAIQLQLGNAVMCTIESDHDGGGDIWYRLNGASYQLMNGPDTVGTECACDGRIPTAARVTRYASVLHG